MKLLKSLTLIATLTLLAGCHKETPPDHSDVISRIQHADKMVFASMAVSKTAKAENSDWYTIGKRIAVYSYKSYLQAYIDLDKVTPDDFVFDEEKKTVTVTLPPVQVEITGRDEQLKKEYENIGLLRSDYDSKERASIKEKTNADFLKEVERNPEFKKQLVTAAQKKARSYFETLFKSQGYSAIVNFK